MSIGSTLAVEEAEEQYKKARLKAICRDAAILVLQEYTRGEAFRKAEEIYQAQEEAAEDPTGAKGTLSEAQSPSLKPGTEAQVATIAEELFQLKY